MRRSTRNRDCQKSPNQPQTKEKAIKPRKARKESSEAKVGTQDTPAVVPDSQGESYEGPPQSSLRNTTLVREKIQDPFHCLSSYEVGLIIDHLPSTSTHTLRLVSKLWKASSEFHNAGVAIRRHFPNASAASKTFETREEANLQFRRLCESSTQKSDEVNTDGEGVVYHQESLKGGFATRAMKCTSAKVWHLNGNSLLWANSVGSVSVHDLRSDKNVPNTASQTLHLNLCEYLGRESQLHDAFLASDGDLLVHATQGEGGSRVRKLARLSREGEIIWLIPSSIPDNFGPIVMGTDAFYYILKSRFSSRLEFVARSTACGLIIYKINLIDRWAQVRDYTYTLKLFNNGKWACLQTSTGKTWILDTLTGTTIHQRACSRGNSLMLSGFNSWYWEFNEQFSGPSFSQVNVNDAERDALFRQPCWHTDALLYTYDEKLTKFKHECLSFQQKQRPVKMSTGFDGDRHLYFRLERSERVRAEYGEWEDPFTTISITTYLPAYLRLPGYEGMSLSAVQPTARVTLPGKTRPLAKLPREAPNPAKTSAKASNRGRARRNFEVSLPYTRQEGDRFTMAGDYLVFHSPEDESLIVLDFWPMW